MAKAQQTKQCGKCFKTKPSSSFSKNSTSKTKLQSYCKDCFKINNARKEVIEKRYEYNKAYLKADKDGVIYTITNPIGEVYTGSTEKFPHIRWSNHKTDYNLYYGHLPLLHKSFDTWGIDAHEFKVIDSYENINTLELREIESNMIKAHKLNGTSLNVKD